jgi:two-component system chemotaxis response regulator CheY
MREDDGLRVLIVDDLDSLRDLLRDLLHGLGIRLTKEASNGVDAMDALRSGAPCGLVITDWEMEPVSGREFLLAVRADAKLKHIPVVVMSANGDDEVKAGALRAGASSFLKKPFVVAELHLAIMEALTSR